MTKDLSNIEQTKRVLDHIRFQISDLEKTINDLNSVLMEQVKVIYQWVLGK